MTRIEDSVIVDAPVDAVFGYVSDWRMWPDWFDGLSDVRPTSEVTRGSGARYMYSVTVMGFPAIVETEMRDFVEGRGWTGVGTRGLPHRTHWLFEAQGQSTRFTYTLEYRVPVPVLGAALDALVLKREWRGILRRSLSNVRGHFLRSAPAPAAAAAEECSLGSGGNQMQPSDDIPIRFERHSFVAFEERGGPNSV